MGSNPLTFITYPTPVGGVSAFPHSPRRSALSLLHSPGRPPPKQLIPVWRTEISAVRRRVSAGIHRISGPGRRAGFPPTSRADFGEIPAENRPFGPDFSADTGKKGTRCYFVMVKLVVVDLSELVLINDELHTIFAMGKLGLEGMLGFVSCFDILVTM